MKLIYGLLMALAFLGGIIFFGMALLTGLTDLTTASAVQVSQIMNTGTYYAAMAIALFVFAMFLAVVQISEKD